MVDAVGISNINSVNMFNAMKAFKPVEKEAQELNIPDVSDGVNLEDNIAFSDKDMEEIMTVAKTAGEENISTEDIRYGATYGRSVIADYVA